MFPLVRRLLLTMALALVLCQVARAADNLWDERVALDAAFRARLETLAGEAEAAGDVDMAARMRAWVVPADPERLILGNVPDRHDLAAPADEAPNHATWRERFKALREAQGEELFNLARRAIRVGQPSLAFELIHEALHENPDHLPARRLLGERRLGDRWASAYEIKKHAAGQVWHERFGWLPIDQVARYESGERPYRGRWITAAEDAAAHDDILRGWQIETEHYQVVTNHSLEAGVQLAARLERLYDVWQRTFATYTVSQEQLARWLEGQGGMRAGPTQRLRVVYFRDREQYNKALRPAQANIDMTIGIYFGSSRTAYFFAGEEQDDATLYHEATHQLFSETRTATDDPGRENNFWLVEAVALYMETLVEHDGYATLGGPEHIRVRAARHRLLVDGFYVPLADLCGLGRQRLQTDPRIAMLYSQASGLAQFLMHAEHGRYREPLIGCLTAVYSGRARRSTLADVTGTAYGELDQRYRAYLEGLPPLDEVSPDEASADETQSDEGA